MSVHSLRWRAVGKSKINSVLSSIA